MVALGLVLAFRTLGTPAHERAITLDVQRAEDLHDLANELDIRYLPNGLPARLSAGLGHTTDPRSDAPYEYHRLGRRAYQLCARFSAPSSEERDDVNVYERKLLNEWKHGSERTCFRRTIGPSTRVRFANPAQGDRVTSVMRPAMRPVARLRLAESAVRASCRA
jgi:hypothetical protein